MNALLVVIIVQKFAIVQDANMVKRFHPNRPGVWRIKPMTNTQHYFIQGNFRKRTMQNQRGGRKGIKNIDKALIEQCLKDGVDWLRPSIPEYEMIYKAIQKIEEDLAE